MKDELNIANALTLLRLILAPFVMYFIIASRPYVALALFFVAIATDAFDGAVARKFNMSTKFGKILDPISDKLLYALVLYGVLIKEKLVLWMWVFAIGIVLFIIAYLLIIKNRIKFPTKIGRVCYFFQFLMLLTLMLGYVTDFVLIVFAVVIAIPPTHYTIKIIKVMKK
ncbi:CDP-alcohol phosphatidyltransferase family protein [Candidatus Woesearchaeota archaeon]|nr:CDP-alcohol phosphatidyltransferase family protein [Candidatus Woesearchaeota archaeon]